ncbi:hypothetical protein L3Y34_016884 [Caenorhabditis briggsae]|uniref:Uncharacterized protein n=1 Tax=Caenorhabditis briggsae TaxID=6238 RepID=A0AAE9IS91_CAEBR|nr:hypothetical protein L3Y34_016884 [Caenorhabditis briggsae]
MDPLVQHPELRPIKAHIPLRLKKVSIEGAKILINKDQLIVEIKDENIEVQALGKVVSTFAFSEETFQALASVLISSGQKVTEFVAWCSGKPKFLNYRSTPSEKLFRVPILADSRGVTTYGPVPYNVLRSLKNAFVFLQDFTPPVADLKGLYDLWKSAKREQGVVTFEIYSKTFKEYKSNIRTWALTSYYKLQFGFPPRKVLCVDFHSKKQIAFTEHVGSSGNVRVSMCIEEKTRVDALFEMFGRLQGLVARWRRSGRPRERESK